MDSFLRGKELSDSDVESLKASLASKKVQGLQKIAVEVSVRLTGSVHKNDIADRLIGMAKIEAAHKPTVMMIVKQVWLFHILLTM